ncbi:DUF2946 family protein [Maricaulis sp. D1M11]|uniref:DUF2946 family protein n=1 Tax=Maricaulis sp. D1M11 TaxID=3076117 RepID=UPI0039B62004
MLLDLRHGRGFLAQLLLALALIAMGVQSALPQGLMLDRNDSTGRIEIVLCHVDGPLTALYDMETGQLVPDDHASHDRGDDDTPTTSTCHLTSHAASAALLASAASLAAPPGIKPEHTRPGEDLARDHAHLSLQRSRAPPHSA